MNHLFIIKNDALTSHTLKQFTWAGSRAHKTKQKPLPIVEFPQCVRQESNLVLLKGEKNPSSIREKALLRVMRQRSRGFLRLLRHVTHKRGAATSVAACGSWLHGQFPLQWDWEHRSPRCISASSWYNGYFSCWLLPNTTFGNILLDLLLHTQKTLFSSTPLSLIPSNTWKHISMDTFFCAGL